MLFLHCGLSLSGYVSHLKVVYYLAVRRTLLAFLLRVGPRRVELAYVTPFCMADFDEGL